jgi:hypothetical protein
MEKTGYSRRILTKAIQSLESKGIITITDSKGQSLECSRSRRGSWLYFSYKHVHFSTQRSAFLGREDVHHSAYNKTNKTKLTYTKGVKSIGEVIANMASDLQKSNAGI